MAKTRYRLVSLPSGAVDTEKHEIVFELSVKDGKPLSFVATYGVAAQITSGLGRMVKQLHQILQEQKGVASSAAEQVEGAHIQKDRWSDTVILQLMTPQGIPYTFAIPCNAVAEMAGRLKTESEKPTQVGTS
jgi:hypothetical protein